MLRGVLRQELTSTCKHNIEIRETKKGKSYVYSSNILSKMILLVAVRRENIAE